MIRTIFNVGGHPPHPPFLYIFIFSFNIQGAKDAEFTILSVFLWGEGKQITTCRTRQRMLCSSVFLCALPPSSLRSCCKIFSFLASHQKRKHIFSLRTLRLEWSGRWKKYNLWTCERLRKELNETTNHASLDVFPNIRLRVRRSSKKGCNACTRTGCEDPNSPPAFHAYHW